LTGVAFGICDYFGFFTTKPKSRACQKSKVTGRLFFGGIWIIVIDFSTPHAHLAENPLLAFPDIRGRLVDLEN
jgi:hypothetical protein